VKRASRYANRSRASSAIYPRSVAFRFRGNPGKAPRIVELNRCGLLLKFESLKKTALTVSSGRLTTSHRPLKIRGAAQARRFEHPPSAGLASGITVLLCNFAIERVYGRSSAFCLEQCTFQIETEIRRHLLAIIVRCKEGRRLLKTSVVRQAHHRLSERPALWTISFALFVSLADLYQLDPDLSILK
jgi:hypothetical protein